MIKLGKRPNDQYIPSTSHGLPPNQTFETILELPFPTHLGRDSMKITGKGSSKNESKTQCAEKACRVLAEMGLINSSNKGSSTTNFPSDMASGGGSGGGGGELQMETVPDSQFDESKKLVQQKGIRSSCLEFENSCLLSHSNGGISMFLLFFIFSFFSFNIIIFYF